MKIKNKCSYSYSSISMSIIWACSLFLNLSAFSQVKQDSLRLHEQKNEIKITAKHSLLTYSGDKISGDEINIPTASLSNMLSGRIPGLITFQGNGEPGNDFSSLAIRGIGTYYNSGIPVFVDGFQIENNYLQAMSALEIESIEVLKDASALASFGMRGANGIIWITTKRGKEGKLGVQFQSHLGFQQATNILKPLNTQKYTQLYNEAISNDNGYWSPTYDSSTASSLPDVDWFNEVLQKTSPYQDINLSMNGGNKLARYYVMLGYVGQNGLYNVQQNDTMANASYNRYNLRTNLDLSISPYIEAKIDIGGYVIARTNPNTNINDLWDNMAKYPNMIYPVKSIQGTEWSGSSIYPNNPVAETKARGRVSSHQRSLQFNLALKEKLDFVAPGLYLQERISLSNWVQDGASNTRSYARYLDGSEEPQTTDLNTPYTRGEDNGNAQWNWQHFAGTLGYDKHWEKHELSATFNALYNTYNTDAARNGAAGLMLYYRYANLNAAINYIYENRYILDLSYTASGSDNYRPGNRWGYYPTVGTAWVISNEDFFQKDVINFFKLRASVGSTGFDPMGEKRFLWQKYYSAQGGFNTGNGTPTWNGGLGLMYLANPDIFAEKSLKFDIGVDASFLNKLNFELNGFVDKRSNIVTKDEMIPAGMGAITSYNNVGKVTNMGYEAKLVFSDKIGDFKYSATAMLSYNSNTIDYMSEVITVDKIAKTGNSIGSRFGYVFDRFYDVTDFDENGNLVEGLDVTTFGKVQPGDIKYKDLLVDGIIDENDQQKIGNSYIPNYYYSFQLRASYKGFDVSAMLQGASGRDVNILDAAPLQTIAFRNNGNVYPIAENRWAYYPEQNIDTRLTASYPRLSTHDNNNNYKASTLWIYDSSYLKFRNIEFGYNFPEKLLDKIKIKDLRIFLSGINLFEFSKLKSELGMNAEVLSGYPAMKSYNIGLTINF